MQKKHIEQKLINEIEIKVPDVKEKVKSCNPLFFNTVKKSASTEKQKIPFYKKISIYACIACAAIAVAIGLPIGLSGTNNSISNTTCIISINPSVELVANKDGIIISQRPLNEDGALLLLKTNLVSMPLEAGAVEVVKLADEFGFLKKQPIRISVANKNDKYNKNIHARVKTSIDGFTDLQGLNVPVNDLTESETNQLMEYFAANNINSFSELIANEFSKHLKLELQKKISETKKFISALEEYALKENNNIIQDADFKFIINDFKVYAYKYKMRFENNLDYLTGDDVFELSENLHETVEELNEVLEDLNEGFDEDEFEDILEDLFEIIKAILINEND